MRYSNFPLAIRVPVGNILIEAANAASSNDLAPLLNIAFFIPYNKQSEESNDRKPDSGGIDSKNASIFLKIHLPHRVPKFLD